MSERSAGYILLTVVFALTACNTGPSITQRDGGTDVINIDDVANTDGQPAGPRYTYWRDVAPLLHVHCNQCHSPGGIGPMPLTTYDEVRPFAQRIARETAARRMPPWPPSTENCRELQNPRVLTPQQIEMLTAWANDGAPEGNRADYVEPMLPPVARPLPPTGDIVVQPAEEYTPNSTGPDDYHCFIMDPGLTETRDVIGVRVTPGNARIVHHVILYEVREEALAELQRLDDAEPGPGYTCFGGVNIPQNFRPAPSGSSDLADFNVQVVVGWAPGSVPGYLPPGTGIRLKPRSRLVMQVHYNTSTSTRGMTDRTRVDLYLSPNQVTQAVWVPFLQDRFTVPAGASPSDPAATVTASHPVEIPARIFGVFPHMHLRGHSIRVDVRHANGSNTCLVNIPRWNFHWQQAYFFTAPYRAIAAPSNRDTLVLTCVYDNTEANQPVIDGVRQPPRDLHWGEGTNDEMCLNFFYVSL